MKLYLCLIILALIPAQSFALTEEEQERTSGFFVEPMAGLDIGDYSSDLLGAIPAGTDQLHLMGPGFSGKAGYVHEVFFAAAEFGYHILNNPYLVANISNLQLGVNLGFTFKNFPMRIWLGANLLDKIDAGLGTSSQSNAYKLGMGYFIFPNVSVNIEFISRIFGQVYVGETPVTPRYNSTFVSISIPLTFKSPPIPVMAERSTFTLYDEEQDPWRAHPVE